MKKQMSSMFAQYIQQITSQVDHLFEQRLSQQEEKLAQRSRAGNAILMDYMELCAKNDEEDDESDDLDPNSVSESF